MKKHILILSAATFLLTAGMFPAAPFAAGMYDGTWEGTTSQGLAFTFDVEEDTIVRVGFSVTYECPSGFSPNIGASVGGGHAPITNGTFVVRYGVTGRVVDSGNYIPSVFLGRFPGSDSASGKILVGYALFIAEGLKTEACTFSGNWTAVRTAP